MTRDQAVEWFWRTCPAGCRIEIVVIRPIRTGQGSLTGWVYVDGHGSMDAHSRELDEFLDACTVLAAEPWQGSLDHDSELVEFVRSAILSAYGRLDACRVAVVR